MDKGKLKIDVRKSAKAIQAIHDILFLDYEVYNGNKQWDVDMLDRIAEAVAKVIPRPLDSKNDPVKSESPVEKYWCDECQGFIPRPGASLGNKHHNKSCSLYDPKEE